MYHRWEIDERDRAEIENKVSSIIDERYPEGRTGVIHYMKDCHDVHAEDYYYWLAWMVFLQDRIVCLELKWGSRGFRMDRIEQEIEIIWTLEGLKDLTTLKVERRPIKDEIGLYLLFDDVEHPIMSCPGDLMDPDRPKGLLGHQKRHRDNFISVEIELNGMLSGTNGPIRS